MINMHPLQPLQAFMAQLVARQTEDLEVASSILAESMFIR